MITKLEIATPGTTDMVTFDVAVPKATTRYLLKDAVGLGPVKADVGTASLAQLDGADYTGSRVNTRNIVIDFDYIPGFTAGTSAFELRQALYAVAGPKKSVEVTFYIQGMGVRRIEGYVESVESPMFSKETTGQLSILCPVPWFVGETVVRTESPSTEIVIDYPGDIPSGVEFVYKTPATGITAFLEMSNYRADTGRQVLSAETLFGTDKIMTFDFRDRRKRALQWDGRNIIPFLKEFNWWKLLPGENLIEFRGYHQPSTPETNGPLPSTPTFEMKYDVYYGGL